MPSHITRSHDMSVKDYYDKYIEPNTEHKCEMCSKPTNFISLSFGYRQYCCQNCSRKATVIKTREKYGVTNISQVPHISKKMRKSIKDNWDSIPEDQRNYRIKSVDKSIQVYCSENNLSPISDLIDIYGTGFYKKKIY